MEVSQAASRKKEVFQVASNSKEAPRATSPKILESSMSFYDILEASKTFYGLLAYVRDTKLLSPSSSISRAHSNILIEVKIPIFVSSLLCSMNAMSVLIIIFRS